MDERFRGASLFDAADDLMVASNGLPVDLSLSGLKLAPFNGKPKGIAADVPRKGKVLLKPAQMTVLTWSDALLVFGCMDGCKCPINV